MMTEHFRPHPLIVALVCLATSVFAPSATFAQSAKVTPPAKELTADELNAREAERAAKVVQEEIARNKAAQAAPKASHPQIAQGQPPQAPRQPTPIAPAPPSTPPVASPPASTPPGVPPPQVTGAPSRPFGQNQIVPPQAPTLVLEVNKGTALKLPGPAATVFVAAPEIADVQVKSPTMVYVFAKKPGDTVLYAVDDQDRVLLNTIVRVTSPLSRIKDSLDAIHPNNGVLFDNQGETIVLSGTVRSAKVAEDARRLALQQVNNVASKVISNINVDAPTQVQVRVKIAEVRKDALKRVGVNFQATNAFGTGLNFAVATVSGIGGLPSAAIGYQGNNLNALIDFLATNNMATILAEPNLVAMSGETANFLAGGEFPVVAPQAGAASSTFSVQYKQVGVSLAFTPTIIGDRINMKIAPEVSQLSATGSVNVPLTPTAVVTIPAVQTRRAMTTVELGSGQSFAIAGLMQQTSQQDITKVPWLGDLPILGALFKSDAYQRNETELVIIITPYFVEPTNGQLRTPMTDRVPPTDADRIFFNRGVHPTAPRQISVNSSSGTTRASAGFKVE